MSPTKNMAASVKQQLLNQAKATKRPFQELLQYYAMERFLYRLSQSQHRERYILKGALMLRAWAWNHPLSMSRPTMDIDMLAMTANTEDNIQTHTLDIIHTPVVDDGLQFQTSTIKISRITEGASYEGIRVRFVGLIERTQVPMQLDIGFGDKVHPSPQQKELPTILNQPPPNLLCYPKESAIAEKFQVMVQLGHLNSRMKDFYDIWTLSQQFAFDFDTLQEAIRQTFTERHCELTEPIDAFTDAFIDSQQTMWNAFRRRMKQEQIPEDFRIINQDLQAFLLPVVHQPSRPMHWTPDSGWDEKP